MSQRYVNHGDIQLWTESFGSDKNPAILLIMGIGGQGIIWPHELCKKLADYGYYVIRYDNRDTGKSGKINFFRSPYSLADMAEDAIAILNSYKIDKAVIVGASMGGTIAQLLALNYPKRVSKIILMISTPDISSVVKSIIPVIFRTVFRLIYPGSTYQLPPPSPEVVKYFRSQILFPFKGREDKLESIINGWRIFSGGGIFDQDECRALVERSFERADDRQGYINHAKAILKSLKTKIDPGDITQPTLVIQGEVDPLFHQEHGEKLAQEIPNAQLEIVSKMGHVIPQALAERLALLIDDHIKRE